MLYYMDNRKITAQERQRFDRLLNDKDSSDGPADSRKNGIESWRFRVRNQLMFPPELGTSEEICRVIDVRSLTWIRAVHFMNEHNFIICFIDEFSSGSCYR
jgi:hypothetical protein